MTNEILTNDDLVNLAIEAVTSPKSNDEVCEGMMPSSWGETSALQQSVGEIAASCNGTLGELLTGIIAIGNREVADLRQEKEYWIKAWKEASDQRDEQIRARDALVHALLESRAQTDTVRKNWSETAFKYQEFCDALHKETGIPADDRAKFLDHIAWLRNEAQSNARMQDLMTERWTLIFRAAGLTDGITTPDRWEILAKHIEGLHEKAQEARS